MLSNNFVLFLAVRTLLLKKNQNAPRPSEHLSLVIVSTLFSCRRVGCHSYNGKVIPVVRSAKVYSSIELPHTVLTLTFTKGSGLYVIYTLFEMTFSTVFCSSDVSSVIYI